MKMSYKPEVARVRYLLATEFQRLLTLDRFWLGNKCKPLLDNKTVYKDILLINFITSDIPQSIYVYAILFPRNQVLW